MTETLVKQRTSETDSRAVSHGAEHMAHLYTDATSLFDEVQAFADRALRAKEAVFLIACRKHITAIQGRLEALGHNPEALRQSGQLTCLEAEKCLEAIMRGSQPNEDAFFSIVRSLLQQALQRFPGVSIYSELVNLLWQAENEDAADLMEQWWNRLIEQYGFTLMCGYRVSLFDERAQAGLAAICRTHTRVVPALDKPRFEQAIDEAMRTTFLDADVAALRKVLMDRYSARAEVLPGHAALLALHQILPAVAQNVRLLARDYYQHGRIALAGWAQ